MDRRNFLLNTAKATAATMVTIPLVTDQAQAATECGDAFTFKQAPLPYAFDALEPVIDKETMNIHYTKHHAAYIKNVNDAIAADHIHVKDASEIFKHIKKYSQKVRDNAGGAWNHDFFWKAMKPGGSKIPAKLSDALQTNFGSFESFKEEFSKAASGRFGSGWAWLVKDGNALKIGSTPNQDNPLMQDADFKGTPLLGLDVWEHAYYLKYQNRRADYIKNWFDIVNWEFVAQQL